MPLSDTINFSVPFVKMGQYNFFITRSGWLQCVADLWSHAACEVRQGSGPWRRRCHQGPVILYEWTQMWHEEIHQTLRQPVWDQNPKWSFHPRGAGDNSSNWWRRRHEAIFTTVTRSGMQMYDCISNWTSASVSSPYFLMRAGNK